MRGRKPGDIVDRPTASLGLEIPETHSRAHYVRRPAALPSAAPAVKTGFDLRSHGIDLRHDTVDAFAIAGVGNAFTATVGVAFAQFCDDDDRLVLAATADAKRARDGPAFDSKGEGNRLAHGHIRKRGPAGPGAGRATSG